MPDLRKTLNSPPYLYLVNWEVLRASVADFLGLNANYSDDNLAHVAQLAGWLCRAHDATGDGGVSRSYTIYWHPFFRRRGWLPSYPETTGYIVPTFFDLFHILGNDDFRRRATLMADWECSIQMDSGAVMGGTVDFKPTPAVFNTGQVIFGWCRAFRETGEGKYLDCARRAGDFLVSTQDPDGAWHKTTSRFAKAGSTVYNTRTSWALLLLDSLTKQERYRAAAIRNLTWALSKQKENGWYSDNCLDDPDRPLLHTIAYAIQGMLESGILLQDERFIESARRPALALARGLREDGSLAGCYDLRWKPAVNWSCLTGNMQMSIAWWRLHDLFPALGLSEAGRRINTFNRRLHDWSSACGGQRGGVKGSHPIYGQYGPFEYPNWAAKFTIDALLMEERFLRNPVIADLESRQTPLFCAT